MPSARPAALAGIVCRRLPWNRRSVQSFGRYTARDRWVIRKVRDGYELLSLPFLAVFLFFDRGIHAGYGVTLWQAAWLANRMRRTTRQVETGTSFRAHLAMAAKILSIAPDVEGVIVEAGCWKGGTTANLSIVADIVGRDLIVYDSFEGLPPPAEGDHWASPLGEGAFRGALEEVRENVARHGVVERCQFRKGWFSDTLADHTEPIVAAFLDVDHQASMHQCLLGLWPHLVDSGYVFVDEYTRLDYCAVFFSERFWRTYFDRPPPGLLGAGTGIALGQYFLGPYRSKPPIQEPQSVGWTRKDFYAEWDYSPDDAPAAPLPGGTGAAHGREGWVTTTVSTEEYAEAKLTELYRTSAEARARLENKLVNTEEGGRLLAERLAKKATEAADGATPGAG
jgi:O-methyltransferase